MNNFNELSNTWESILQIESINLEELSESTGVLDVLTTLNNTVNEDTTEERGIHALAEDLEGNQRESISLMEMMERSSERDTSDEQVEDDLEESIEEFIEDVGEVGGDSEVEQETTITLSQLFSRQSRLTDLDTQGEVSLTGVRETLQASTYTRPSMRNYMGISRPIVEFGEDVLVARSAGTFGTLLAFSRDSYENFNRTCISERNQELENQRLQQDSNRKEVAVKDIVESMFGERFNNMYGYDTIGKTDEGLPYIKAVLSTRFTKLYDRRFRKPEEMRETSRDVAVTNKNQSVKAFIEMTVRGTSNGELEAVIEDSEGERIPYLEQKMVWLKENDYKADTWVLYLKTQFEFEDTITSMEQLKTLDFNLD